MPNVSSLNSQMQLITSERRTLKVSNTNRRKQREIKERLLKTLFFFGIVKGRRIKALKVSSLCAKCQ